MSIEKRCLICKEPFYIYPCQEKKGVGIYCSPKCKGISMRGKSSWNKNKKLSKKHKENLSNSMKGKHNSADTEFEKGQRSYWSGRRNPKLSKRQKGKKNPMYGKIPHNKGKPHSKKTKEKISNYWKKYYANDGIAPTKGKRWKLSEKTRKEMRQSRLGEKGYNWKGGITSENHRIRNGFNIRFWREKVFKRDNYTCQKTKIRGGILRCHHIKTFADYPESRFDIDNGITLSDKIHKEFHKIYGVKNNTREQLKEFLKVN